MLLTMKTLYYAILLSLLAFSFAPSCYARSYSRIPLPFGAVGPETIAFDPYGGGPYVGISDGRILRFDQTSRVWLPFATMPTWSPRCIGINNSPFEPACGRPLGLMFHPTTGELYVADAYHGLVIVGRDGGRGVSVATTAEGVPFKFTNSLDINPQTGVVFFTDSSTRFGRRQFGSIFTSGDNTGRLMSYNPSNGVVQVLQRNLRFPNGVALSRNMDYLLFTETSTGQIHRLWLRGPRYLSSDLFMTIRGRPDNINRAPDGNFWIAQVPLPFGGSGDGGMPLKVNEQAQILSRLDVGSGELVTSASDVKEYNGRLWIGNVIYPYIEVASH